MPAGRYSLGPKFTRTYTSSELDMYAPDLGARAEDEAGRVFRFIQANGAISAGDVIAIGDGYDCAPLSGAGIAWAVAPVAIADNEYGWVQTRGQVDAAVASSLSAGDDLAALTNGSGQLQGVAAVDEGGSTSHSGSAHALRAIAFEDESSNSASVELL